MQVVQVLAVDQQVEHVVALAADLQADLDPVEFGGLEELGRLEEIEEVALLEGARRASVELGRRGPEKQIVKENGRRENLTARK